MRLAEKVCQSYIVVNGFIVLFFPMANKDKPKKPTAKKASAKKSAPVKKAVAKKQAPVKRAAPKEPTIKTQSATKTVVYPNNTTSTTVVSPAPTTVVTNTIIRANDIKSKGLRARVLAWFK